MYTILFVRYWCFHYVCRVLICTGMKKKGRKPGFHTFTEHCCSIHVRPDETDNGDMWRFVISRMMLLCIWHLVYFSHCEQAVSLLVLLTIVPRIASLPNINISPSFVNRFLIWLFNLTEWQLYSEWASLAWVGVVIRVDSLCEVVVETPVMKVDCFLKLILNQGCSKTVLKNTHRQNEQLRFQSCQPS